MKSGLNRRTFLKSAGLGAGAAARRSPVSAAYENSPNKRCLSLLGIVIEFGEAHVGRRPKAIQEISE
jgi:hypothetical protein